MADDSASPAPLWRLDIYAHGQPALSLHQMPNGPVTLEGDPTYIEDLELALHAIRFFADERKPPSTSLN